MFKERKSKFSDSVKRSVKRRTRFCTGHTSMLYLVWYRDYSVKFNKIRDLTQILLPRNLTNSTGLVNTRICEEQILWQLFWESFQQYKWLQIHICWTRRDNLLIPATRVLLPHLGILSVLSEVNISIGNQTVSSSIWN